MNNRVLISNVHSKSSIAAHDSPDVRGSNKMMNHLEETPEYSSVHDSIQFISPRIPNPTSSDKLWRYALYEIFPA